MRTFLLFSLLLIGNVLLAQSYGSFIKDMPRPARVVNDFGAFLSRSEETSLENKLIAYRKKSGNAIVIITLSSLTDRTGNTWSVEETALQYFNKWGIGDRRKNNGVLILLSREPRRVRIATGIGLEGTLTDNDCQRIIDETLLPSFKAGRYYTGLNEGVNDIQTVLGSGVLRTRLHSGTQEANSTPVNDVAQPQALAQTQTQTQPQYGSTYTRRPPTLGESIFSILMLALAVWLRVKYVRSRRPQAETYSAEGFSGAVRNNNVSTSSRNDNVADYLSATGWVLLILFKIVWWCCVFVFSLIGIMFGLASFSRLGSPFRGSSSGAGASFGGGRSAGGGASGSW